MLSYKFKLYVNKKKNRKLRKIVNECGLTFNHCVRFQKKYYGMYKKHLHKFSMINHIKKIKDKNISRTSYLKRIPSQACQQVIIRVDESYRAFFKWAKAKKGGRKSPPKMKKIRKFKSFTLVQAGWSIEGDNKIRIVDTIYKFHRSSNVQGQIKTITVKQDSVGDWWLIFTTDPSKSLDNIKDNKKFTYMEKFKKDDERRSHIRAATGKSAGYDFGLMTYLTSSEGKAQDIENPQFLKQGMKKLKRLSKKHSKRKRGSKNRQKSRKALARFHRRVTWYREDFLKKTARKICLENDALYFEDLNIKGMQQHKNWGRKINDLAFSNFMVYLEHKASELGTSLIKVDRYFPSSKLCNCCGYKNTELGKKDRTWTCPECKTEHDRDRNAAINIKREGASSQRRGK